MIYYAKDNVLYASEVVITDENFVEITEDEYNSRLNSAVENREQGIPETDFNFDDEATEEDYINALESLGVNFNG